MREGGREGEGECIYSRTFYSRMLTIVGERERSKLMYGKNDGVETKPKGELAVCMNPLIACMNPLIACMNGVA